MKKTIYLIILASAFLTACQTITDWQRSQRMKAIQNGADYCGKKYIKPFLGTHFDNVIVTDHLPNKYEFRIADPRTLGDDEVTADFKGFRLNIRLDQNGIIKSLKCG